MKSSLPVNHGLPDDRYLNGDRRGIVLANGDTVEDGEGGTPSEPLNSPTLVATYEKYLAMLAGTGISADMSRGRVMPVTSG